MPSSAYPAADSLPAVPTSHQPSKTIAEKAVQKEDSVHYADVGTVTTGIADIAVVDTKAKVAVDVSLLAFNPDLGNYQFFFFSEM